MSILVELASMQGRKDEEPNKELGKRLVETANLEGIREAVDNLRNEDKKIQIDCLAVLEQVGLLAPRLIDQLNNCRPKSLPQYTESILVAVNPDNQTQYLAVLNKRLDELSAAQGKRVNKIIRSFE